MAAGDRTLNERLALVFPPRPTPGSLGVLVPESRVDEMKELERNRQPRVWKVRGVVSDTIPLAGSVQSAIGRATVNTFLLNQNPISIYVHHGGNNAVYYDLVGYPNGMLWYAEVSVETDLPSNAFLYSRKPLNELLDLLGVSQPKLPLSLVRLELFSPRDNNLLAYEVTLPFTDAITFGPLGGIWQAVPFAPYDAIFREALTSTSPYYRFLCAYRVYDGIAWICTRIREMCQQLGIDERMPRDPVVEIGRLRDIGFTEDFCVGIRTAQDLFDKLRDLRDAAAHFLIDGAHGEQPLDTGAGEIVLTYSLAAAVLLDYADQAISSLRLFYRRNIEPRTSIGSILPTPEIRDRFIVHAPRQ